MAESLIIACEHQDLRIAEEVGDALASAFDLREVEIFPLPRHHRDLPARADGDGLTVPHPLVLLLPATPFSRHYVWTGILQEWKERDLPLPFVVVLSYQDARDGWVEWAFESEYAPIVGGRAFHYLAPRQHRSEDDAFGELRDAFARYYYVRRREDSGSLPASLLPDAYPPQARAEPPRPQPPRAWSIELPPGVDGDDLPLADASPGEEEPPEPPIVPAPPPYALPPEPELPPPRIRLRRPFSFEPPVPAIPPPASTPVHPSRADDVDPPFAPPPSAVTPPASREGADEHGQGNYMGKVEAEPGEFTKMFRRGPRADEPGSSEPRPASPMAVPPLPRVTWRREESPPAAPPAPAVPAPLYPPSHSQVTWGRKESPPVAPMPQVEPVLFSASAPPAARPGDEFVARLAVHTRRQQRRIATLFRALSRRARSHMGGASCRWPAGTRAVVRVSGTHLAVSPAEQALAWEGEAIVLSFDVRVDDAAPVASTVLRFDVLVAGLLVARLRLDLDIRAQRPVLPRRRRVEAEPARTAFASYAMEDRARVIDRIAEVQRIGVDVFADCLSLKPGEQWKPALEREISGREAFYLFWSIHAKQSQWVDWEWRTALRLKGITFIAPHPLDPPSDAAPPEELKDLHFGDPLMIMRKAMTAPAPPGA